MVEKHTGGHLVSLSQESIAIAVPFLTVAEDLHMKSAQSQLRSYTPIH